MHRLALVSAAVLLGTTLAIASEPDPAAALIRQLREADQPAQRAEIIKGLSELKPLPPLIVVLVARRLGAPDDSNEGVVHTAILSELREAGPAARSALPEILARSRDKGIRSDELGLAALRAMFPAHQDLFELMGRSRACWQAGLLLLREREAALRDPLPLLATGLEHPSADVRLDVLEHLAAQKERARPALDGIVKLLADEDARVRIAAIQVIGRLGLRVELPYDERPGYGPLWPKWLYHAPPEAEPALRRALADPDALVGVNAAQVLVRGSHAGLTDSLPILIVELRSPERRRRSVAVYALENLGRRSREERALLRGAVPALREVILDKSDYWEDTWIKSAAAEALVSIATPEEGVPIVLECYTSGTVWRPRVLQILPQYGANERAVSFLVDAIHSHEPDVDKRNEIAEYAVAALGKCRPVRDQSVARLTEINRGENLRLRSAALSALADIGNQHTGVLPALLEAAQLPDRDGQHRARAFDIIARLGPDEAIVTAMIPLLQHRDALVRESAARTLGQLRILARPAVPALASHLRDGNADVRQAAAFALGEIGPAAEAAIPALIAAMKRHHGYWYDSPAEALSKIGPAAVPRLVKELRLDRGQNEFGPSDVLRKLGPQAAAAVPELTAMASGQDELLQVRALHLLSTIGPAAESAVPQLIRLREDPTQKQNVDQILIKIGGPAVEVFVRDLNPADPPRCAAALASLEAMGKQAEKAIPTLKLLLKSDRSELRFAAAKALATIDRGDAELLAVIDEMLSHESPQVRGDGGRALGQLGIGNPTDRVVKMLLKATTVGDENVRNGLAYSLVRMNQAKNRELLPTLTALLVKNERTTGLEHELAQAIINLLDDSRAGGS